MELYHSELWGNNKGGERGGLSILFLFGTHVEPVRQWAQGLGNGIFIRHGYVKGGELDKEKG